MIVTYDIELINTVPTCFRSISRVELRTCELNILSSNCEVLSLVSPRIGQINKQ